MTIKKFAVFDIDGTLSRTSLYFQIVDELVGAKKLPADSRKKLDEAYNKYRKRTHGSAFKDYAEVAVDLFFSNLHKVRVEDYKQAVDKVIKRAGSHLYVFTRDLAKSLNSQGYFTVALSGSEMYSVQQFTKKLKFDLAIGEYYHESKGYFTGKIDHVIHDKGTALKKLVVEHGLTFKDSVAVGDSLSDAAMLELVENPIAFNPEDGLFERAKQRHWKIVIERKNVIYHLEPKNGRYVLAEAN